MGTIIRSLFIGIHYNTRRPPTSEDSTVGFESRGGEVEARTLAFTAAAATTAVATTGTTTTAAVF